MNILLLGVLIALACGALAVRNSPSCMREMAAWLRTTADTDENRKAFFKQRLNRYRLEMDLPDQREKVRRMRERVL